jgi:hypothetical protein
MAENHENPYESTGHVGDAPLRRKGPRPWVTVLMVLGIGTLLVLFLLPARRTARGAARRNACMNNLHQISLALLNYESMYHALPPAYTVDADGKPLHSWRTLILPFLEENQLYKTIDLSKPWDDPANAKAFNTAVAAYQCPADGGPLNTTTYLAVVAPNGCFRLTEPRQLSEITDAPFKTLMVVEAPSDRAVPWMCPQDADEQLLVGFGPDSKLAHSGGVCAAFVDSSIRFINADLPAAQRRALITIAGHDDDAAFVGIE